MPSIWVRFWVLNSVTKGPFTARKIKQGSFYGRFPCKLVSLPEESQETVENR